MVGIDVARMPTDIPLRCRCERVRGVAREVSPFSGFRFVCYCTDSQTFARFLGAAGRAWCGRRNRYFPDAGPRETQHRRRAKVLRWYADCRKTPIANTAATARFPVVALIQSSADSETASHSRDEALGPPLCRIYERSAIGPLPATAPPSASFAVFVRRAAKILGWWMRGLGRPNPFFDDRTNAPLATPRVLTPSEPSA